MPTFKIVFTTVESDEEIEADSYRIAGDKDQWTDFSRRDDPSEPATRVLRIRSRVVKRIEVVD